MLHHMIASAENNVDQCRKCGLSFLRVVMWGVSHSKHVDCFLS